MIAEQTERISRYLEDAIALEASLVTGLKEMMEAATDPEDAMLFQQHLAETERQKERLETVLHARGEHTNRLKDLMNKIGVSATSFLHLGKDSGDKATRNLIEAYAIENLEIAMYESLYAAASEVGDTEVAGLAKEIQAEEQATAHKILPRIAPNARNAVRNGNDS